MATMIQHTECSGAGSRLRQETDAMNFKVKRTWRFLLAVGALIAFPAHADTSQVQKTFEQRKMEAVSAVYAFASEMSRVDPSYATTSMENKIVAAIPVLGTQFPPEQWLTQVKFLYSALREIERQRSLNDPDEILARHFEKEETAAGPNVRSRSSELRTGQLSSRFEELAVMKENKALSEVDHAARVLAAAMIYFPNDKKLGGLLRYKLELTLELGRGEISREKYLMLWKAKQAEYEDKRQTDAFIAEAEMNAQQSRMRWEATESAINRMRESIPARRPTVTCTTVGHVTTCN